MNYLDTFRAIVQPIDDVFRKTEEKTKFVFKSGNIKISISINFKIGVYPENVTFPGPIPNEPFFTSVITPIPTSEGTRKIPLPFLVIPHNQQFNSPDNPEDSEGFSHITLVPQYKLNLQSIIPITFEKRTSRENLERNESSPLLGSVEKLAPETSIKNFIWNNRATEEANSGIEHETLESQCGIMENSDSGKIRPSLQDIRAESEGNFSIDSAVEKLPYNKASPIFTVSQTSTEPPYYQQVFSKFLNEGVVYFRKIEEKLAEKLYLVKKTSPKNIGQLIRKLEELKDNNAKLVEALHRLQTENFKSVTTEVEHHPDFILLKECAEKIIQNYDQLTFDKMNHLFQNETVIDVQEEHFLCSILGLNDSVVSCLLDMDQSLRSHQTYKYWICQYLEENQPDEYGVNVQKDFEKMGFTSERAHYLAKQISLHPFADHNTLLNWATRYIEDVFNYDSLLNQCSNSIPLPQNGGQKEVIWKKEELEESHDKNQSNRDIIGMKINFNDLDNTSIQPYLSNQALKMKDVRYWFHGTDHKSAWDIIKNGIRLEFGKARADFSDQKGFYLTSNFQFAKKWPQSMMKKKSTAVIVFKIEDSDEFFHRYKGLEFLSGNLEWEKELQYYRNGAQENSKKRREKESTRKYIYGPLSMDGSKANNPQWKPRVRDSSSYGGNSGEPLMQLYLKDDFLADDIIDESNILVIFFE